MKPVRLSILAAVARNGVIGKCNTLPWHLPEDLKHFKSLTMGHTIIMGRKTYASIGRVLPGRVNVIVTSQPDFRVPDAIVVHTLEAALQQREPGVLSKQEDELFIIGGARLYEQTLGLVQRLYLTEIQQDFDGDAFFPEFDRREWSEISRERHISDGKTGIPLEYHFVILDRK
ncbi:MAG: dihydrofolate reductase [Nitrosomonas sp.]|nr:dihydrofolate reductase [Nitrosomonas sp.]